MLEPSSVQLFSAPLKGKTKKEKTELLSNVSSEFILYTCAEGIDAGSRVSASNPARLVHGLVVDFDHPFTPERVQEALERQEQAGLPMPHWMEISLSGRLHVVWFFERPIIAPGDKALWDEILKAVFLRVGASGFYPAADSHSCNVTQVWTASGDSTWVNTDDGGLYPLVSGDLLDGILDECLSRWETSLCDSLSMTPEQAFEPLKAKFGDRFEWEGDFTAGALGPSFFVEGSASPKSAHVKKTGILSYSDHARAAGKTFYTWADLLGERAMENYRQKALPERLRGIWTDGTKFWIEPAPGQTQWRQETADAIQQHLKAKRGISSKVGKGEVCSQLDQAMEFLRFSRRVAGATRLAFQPSGVIRSADNDDSQIINTCVGTALPPQADSDHRPWAWGEGGGFETLCHTLEAFLPDDFEGGRQLDYLLAWLHRFYKAAHEKKMNHGHVLVIVGKPSCGKTFFCEVILAPLFRLCARAETYLLGEARWNEGLYASGLWFMDDVAKCDVDPVQLASRLKKELTQTSHNSEEKFQKMVKVNWRGRAAILANPDVDSLQVVPALDDESNTTKFLLFKASDPDTGIDFSDSDDLAKKITDELPRFAAWLLNRYTMPDYLREKRPRFGFIHYIHPEIKDLLDLANQDFSLVQYLKLWARTVAEDPELSAQPLVKYDQFKLIHCIESAWDTGKMTNPLARQLFERRFPQRLAHLIGLGKLPFLKYKPDREVPEWILNLNMVRKMMLDENKGDQ